MNGPTLDPVRLLDMTDKKGLIVGVANEHSLAWAAARNCHAAGADLALTYLNEKARPFVEPLAQSICAPLLMPCDVAHEGELETVFAKITETWGKLDFLVHAIAWAPADDLHGRLTDCSAEGFTQAMQVSCHSFIRMAKLAEPLMHQGGNLTTLTFIGAERVVDHYSLMGPVKAALETSVRYLAHELGPKGIRVNAICPGFTDTDIVASAVENISAKTGRSADESRKSLESFSPMQRLIAPGEVAALVGYLVTDAAASMTGAALPLDGGETA